VRKLVGSFGRLLAFVGRWLNGENPRWGSVSLEESLKYRSQHHG